MSTRGAIGILAAAACLTLGGLPGREYVVMDDAAQKALHLEAQVAAHPDDSTSRIALARAYLEASSPGLAWRTVADAPEWQRDDPALSHMAARVLLEQGKAREALEAERRVLARCDTDAPTGAPPCERWLVTSAVRRAEIIEQLVRQGVEDAKAQPEATMTAYYAATHEASLVIEP